MTRREERLLLNTTLGNSEKLDYIIKVLNTYLYNHSKENNEDFERNVLANLVSNIFAIDRNKK